MPKRTFRLTLSDGQGTVLYNWELNGSPMMDDEEPFSCLLNYLEGEPIGSEIEAIIEENMRKTVNSRIIDPAKKIPPKE